jgi:hypothetical protein
MSLPLPFTVLVAPQTHLSIDVPPGWLVDASGKSGTLFYLWLPPMSGGFSPNVNIIVQPLGALTRDEWLTLSRLQIRQQAGATALSADEASPNSLPSNVVEWLGPPAPVRLWFRQRILWLTDAAVVLTATAPAAAFEGLRPVLAATLESARLERTASAEGPASGLP